MSTRTTLASGNRTCPVCGQTDERLPRHWSSESCSWPDVTRRQHDLVIGLLLGNATISGESANKCLQLVATNRTFATWIFEELDWLADSLVRIDPPNSPDQTEHAANHCYRVRARTHPKLMTYRERGDASGEKRVPLHLDLPVRSACVWYACSGELHWQDDSTLRQYSPRSTTSTPPASPDSSNARNSSQTRSASRYDSRHARLVCFTNGLATLYLVSATSGRVSERSTMTSGVNNAPSAGGSRSIPSVKPPPLRANNIRVKHDQSG